MLTSNFFKPKGQFLISDKTAPLVQDILLENRRWDLKCVPKRRWILNTWRRATTQKRKILQTASPLIRSFQEYILPSMVTKLQHFQQNWTRNCEKLNTLQNSGCLSPHAGKNSYDESRTFTPTRFN